MMAFEQIAFQCVDGCLNDSRPIVAGDDFDAPRQSLLNLSEILLDPVDDCKSVLPVAHHDDAADSSPRRRSTRRRPRADQVPG